MTKKTAQNGYTHWQYTVQTSNKLNIGILTIDAPNKSLDSLTMVGIQELQQILQDVLYVTNPTIQALIVTNSAKGIVGGADISMFAAFETAEQASMGAGRLQAIFHTLHTSPIPTIAMIHGSWLGGGFEMALACQYRVAANHAKTKLGLPEVKLGILPGAGGTQRLPRLIGIQAALDFILTGKNMSASKALKLGVLDALFAPNTLLEQTFQFIGTKIHGKYHNMAPINAFSSIQQATTFPELAKTLVLEANPIGRKIILKQATKGILKNTKGFYPAPLLALQAVLEGAPLPLEKGLALEAKLFGRLAVSPESRSLVHIFMASTHCKKNPTSSETQSAAKAAYAKPLSSKATQVGIIGAGLMGSGVATVLAEKNIPTVLLDTNPQGMEVALKNIRGYFKKKVARKRLTSIGYNNAMLSVSPTTDYASLRHAGIVVEAVFESLEVKKQVIASLESQVGTNTIIATNTSSIPITQIAQLSTRPSQVIGMHFFSPVPKMPLVEIITHAGTDPQVLSAIFDLTVRMGKQPVVVSDGPGFYTTRILAFQIAEALQILNQGNTVESIDKAMESFGMPVGPITLLDEVGIDVGSHIVEVLQKSFGYLDIPKEIENISKQGRKGRKNSFGFYVYENDKKLGVDPSVYTAFSVEQTNPLTTEEIQKRCVFVFLNEAARCLDEGILPDTENGDIGAVFGLGFPPFLGGPFHYAKTLGHETVKQTLLALSKQYGSRFTPAKYWG
jgi:3-hydroxyacyl-CoA dehydrogenase / enoyl-CoA hydratase / 3-hydroxybutyryl-CoA epimerase